jgi:hypothetical protein
MPTGVGPIVIEGIVVREVGTGDDPISGVEVSVQNHDEPSVIEWPPPDPTPVPVCVAHGCTGADGSFAFQALPYRQYQVRARLPTGEEKQIALLRPRVRGITKVRFVFGTAQLHGVVRAAEGTPLPGIPVRLDPGDSAKSAGRESWCFTNSVGEYSFGRLATGPYELSVGSRSSVSFVRRGDTLEPVEGWPNCKCSLRIIEGDDLTIDVGTPEGACLWRGCIRTPLGDRYAVGKAITLEREWRSERGSEVKLTLRRTPRGPEGFLLHVPAGVWKVSVAFAERDTWRPDDPLTFGGSEMDRDLLIPGTRITGMVLDASTGAPLRFSKRAERIRVRRFMHDDDPDPDHDALISADGTYTLLVHGAGDWVLSAEPIPLSQGQNRLDIEIPAAEQLHHLDLEVKQP